MRAAFDGRVVTSDDPGYDQARSILYGAIDHRPAMIVRPIDATEVARASMHTRRLR